MAVKRKFDSEADDAFVTHQNVKQPRLFSFPTSELDTDVAMSDGSISDVEPLFLSIQPHHTRLSSNASYSSSSSATDSPGNSPMYPVFDLYPHDSDSYMNVVSSTGGAQKNVGLMQPKSASFTHHGQNCSQIPKLRIACESGLNGQRSMWAHCEECGAIEMVDTD